MSQNARRFDSSVAPGAMPAPFPGFVQPCNPTLRENAPSGVRWIHEIKFDGYRTQAHLQNGQPTIYTRAGYDWTLRFQPIADALAALPAKDLILDGELSLPIRTASLISGCFTPISPRAAKTGCSITRSICSTSTDSTSAERDLLSASACSRSCWPAPPNASSTPSTWKETAPRSISAPAQWALKASSANGRPRRIDPAGWRAGSRSNAASAMRSRSWLSSRSSVPSRGKSPRSMWAAAKATRLLYAGKVRSGYTEALARDVREWLDPFIRKDSPLSEPVKKPKATWAIEAEVAYSTVTEHGLLREAVFQGLRAAREVAPARRT
jgi:bifunctional non-homologous end joining protein LigD